MDGSLYVFLANIYLDQLKNGFITFKEFETKIDTLLDCTEYLGDNERVVRERFIYVIKQTAIDCCKNN